MPDSDSSPIVALHFADVHFGVETYGRYDPATGLSTRLLDFRAALMAAIEEALRRNVEVALFAGDAYKARDPSQTHQRAFADCLKALTSAGVPVVLLTGNHDIPNTKGKANAIEIYDALGSDLLHVLDRRAVRVITTKRGRPLRVAAIPYLTKSALLARDEQAALSVQETTEAVETKYEEAIIEAADECRSGDNIPTVFMGHFTVGMAEVGVTQAGYLLNEPKVSKEALNQPDGFDYVALGHIHKYQDLNHGEQPPMVYPGSIERIDFGERGEAKGVVFANIARGHTDFEFFHVPTRPFLEITSDTTKKRSKRVAATGEDMSESDEAAAGDPTEIVLADIAKHADILPRAVVKLLYKIAPEDAPLLRERDIRQAMQPSFMLVAQQREVVGESGKANVRSKLLTQALEPLDALSVYLDSKEHLAKRKEDLMGKAKELWQELIKAESA